VNTEKNIYKNSVVDPHWFQCATDPAFYLNMDPDPDYDPESQTNADPDPSQTLS
jgi:hypothetical protein